MRKRKLCLKLNLKEEEPLVELKEKVAKRVEQWMKRIILMILLINLERRVLRRNQEMKQYKDP